MVDRLTKRLRRDEEGATLVEFAFVAPVLILMIVGLFDIAHSQYTSSLMNGAMQQAGRNLTLESAGSQQGTIDQRVISQVQQVAPSNATVTLEKLSHFDFSDIGEAEDYDDDNDNSICDAGEAFVDSNGNGQWDSNRGASGIGGARDAVLYTVVVKYPRLFPMYGLTGQSKDVELRASTVLRNQPFDEQDRTVTTGNCD